MIDNPDHSEEDDRFIIFEMSGQANILLVVCQCCLLYDFVIKLILARRAVRNIYLIVRKTNEGAVIFEIVTFFINFLEKQHYLMMIKGDYE